MKLAIIGSRNCPRIDILAHLKNLPDAIVSGGARGADTYAREFAKTHGLQCIEFLPDYDTYGRRAPLVRNDLIVNECDCLLAFWDGESRGTWYTINKAKEAGKPVKIVNFITNQVTVDYGSRSSK